MMSNFRYVGSELDVFANASHWKAYWAHKISPYVGARVLEVGAGIGSNIQMLSNDCQRWLALEPDEMLAKRTREIIARAGLNKICDVRTGTLSSIDRGEKFDTILYIDVLEHIEDHRGELERAADHLTRGGFVVVLSPAHQWLYTAFDKAVGHIRRYNKKTLLAATPPSLRPEKVIYLDSVGILASFGNRLFLQASGPSEAQVRFWDAWMVPLSVYLDSRFRYKIGKTVLAIWQKRK
jgi:protein-L-isoaspartate O-methyltransferase